MATKKLSDDDIAVLAIDPGVTTGVCMGVAKGAAFGSVGERIRAGWHETWQIEGGTEVEHAIDLAREWHDFDAEQAIAGVPVGRRLLVIENWVPRLPLRSAKREIVAPVRVASALEGVLVRLMQMRGREPVYQMPSEAMQYGKADRLREWGLWEVGMEHGRDASRHFALCVAKRG